MFRDQKLAMLRKMKEAALKKSRKLPVEVSHLHRSCRAVARYLSKQFLTINSKYEPKEDMVKLHGK